MAELLQRLLANTRQNPRRIQYDPFEGFSGPNPGLRGSMPANALDTQDATDMAQGIDIGSVAPTRLRPSPIQMTAYSQDDGGDDEEPSGTPVVQTGQRRVCGEDGCFIVDDSMPVMQQGMMAPQMLSEAMAAPARVLPEGVVEGPGERFVEGSLREVPATAMAPQATAAPPASAPTAAPQSPAGSQATAARQGDAQPQPYEDPNFFFNQSQGFLNDARSAAQMSRAVEANFSMRMAMQSYQAGLMAAATRNQMKIAEMTNALGNRAMTLQEQRFQAETGQLTPSILDNIRNNRKESVQSRALSVLRVKYSDMQPELRPQDPNDMKLELRKEIATVAAGDMASHMQTISQIGTRLRQAIDSKASPEAIKALELGFAQAETQLEFTLRERLRDEPQQMWESSLRNELYPAYLDVFRDQRKASGGDPDDGAAEMMALQAIQNHIGNLGRIMQKDGYASPLDGFMSGLRSSPAQEQPATQAPPQQPQANDDDTERRVRAAAAAAGSGFGGMF